MGDLIAELLAAAGRLFSRIAIDLVLEVIVKGTGYPVARCFHRGADPDGLLVILCGAAVWTLVGTALWAAAGLLAGGGP